jgi:hypothetical protein
MNRGLTLIELMVGIVTAAIMTAVCVNVLFLGIRTYNYAARQTGSLTRTRRALAGDGVRAGVLGASRGAYAFSAVQASSVTVLSSSSSIVTNYYVTNGNLYRTKAGSSVRQADGVSSISLGYYMSTAGMISSTTAISSASMVTVLVNVGTGTSSAQRTYRLFAGAQLREHP